MNSIPLSAKFAPVAPIQLLTSIYEDSPKVFGDYHLLLAHHTVEEEKAFRDLFKRIQNDGHFKKGLTIIMDNSLVELKGAVSLDLMLEACDIILESCEDAQVIAVLPDAMGDGDATRHLMQIHCATWLGALKHVNGFMAVAQGSTYEDYLDTLNYINLFDEIDWIGIPRILVETCGSRVPATLKAVQGGVHKKIHLLGFSDNMEDDMVCAGIGGVSGIDSAVPLRMKDAFSVHADPGPRPEFWFNKATYTPQVTANIISARQHVAQGF